MMLAEMGNLGVICVTIIALAFIGAITFLWHAGDLD